jgi:hypothetical protein
MRFGNPRYIHQLWHHRMVNELAPALKTMLSITILDEIAMAVVFDFANVAMSAGSSGTVMGVQLAAVFQSLLVGLSFHVALLARV